MFYAVLCLAVSIYAHTVTPHYSAFALALNTAFKIEVISIIHKAQCNIMSTLGKSRSDYTQYVLRSTAMISKNSPPLLQCLIST